LRWEFLAIDHRNGGGHRERRRLSALSLWIKLLKLGTPQSEYRVLCHNCNSAIGFYGYCPHQAEMPMSGGSHTDVIAFDTETSQNSVAESSQL
jgi:hypothetical protein